MISLIGFVMAYISSTPKTGYVAAIIAAVGVFPTIPVTMAWVGGNVGGEVKRAVVLAMVVGFGQLSGYVSTFKLLLLTRL
jgi:hypothetical protein